ncbi:MAG: hypothetical protein D3908_05975, partial [Candidatus Electrothrix sp. AUS4]|nr:hypothetical protein [Candidatus Electrothrix sp. AUS4]
MITQLEIKNFRGFSEYKIEDVGQVNLLVGTNNCGKTSILEAVHLLKSRGDAAVLFSLLSRRGERIQNEERTHRDAEGDLCRLFHGFRLTPESSLVISAADHTIEKLSVSINETQPVQLHLFKDFVDSAGRYQLDVEWGRDQDRNTKQEYPISYTGGLSYHYMRKMSHASKSSIEDDRNIEFVPASSLAPQEIVALFDKIVLTPDEELVLETVKIIEPDIIRLASLGVSDGYYPLRSGDYARGGIIVKSSKWEERIPIGSFGDGIWRLLGLILSLVGAKNGTLLIDEIDTGLHHTVMSKMWQLICTTARKLNVQVFATTHSSDCWKTLADNAVEEEFADMPIRI